MSRAVFTVPTLDSSCLPEFATQYLAKILAHWRECLTSARVSGVGSSAW